MGDGNQDVVLGVAGTRNVQIVFGDGQGGFGIPVEFPAFPSTLAAKPGKIVLGDIDGDGNLDLVTLDFATSGALSVLFGDGAGNLGNPTVYNVYDTRNPGDTRYVVWSAAIGDVNGDGKPDLIVGAANNFFTSKGDVWVFLNDGSGNFAPPTIVWTRFMGHGDVPAQFVATGDLDGDGNGDIVVTSGFGQFGSGNAVTVLYGNGTGTFPSTVGMPFPLTPNGRANQAQGVVIADMDGIGLRDLVVSASDIGGTRTGGVTVFRSTGARTFDAGTTYPTLFFRNGMGAVGDLNGDGHPDVMVTGATSGDSFAYFLNNGSGGLGASVYLGGLSPAYALAVGDLTNSGPGTLDIVVGTLSTSIGTKLLQNGPAGQPNQPPVADAGEDQTVECADPSGTAVTLDGSNSSDPDGDALTYTWRENGDIIAGPTTDETVTVTLGLGAHTIELTVDDGNGGTDADEALITVEDTTPPTLTLESSVAMWPPNHKYETFALAGMVASVSDVCDADVGIADVTIVSVSSDEPENARGNGDGNTVNDIVIAPDGKSVDLRAERQGRGNGRVYTVNLSVTDASGNEATAAYLVTVPKSRNGLAAIDDGPAYTVNAGLPAKPAAPPSAFALSGARPNPFNPSTTIAYEVPQAAHVTLVVYNLLGREVIRLVDAQKAPGRYTATWHGRNAQGQAVASGIYLYRLTTSAGFSETRRMTLLK